MAQMHTLIINGQAYTLVDAAAARIDDSAVGENTWSSRQIVNRLCPSFAQSGSKVVCTPVVGHPLRVVSHIAPVQEGSGDPSPDNLRPITGWEQVVVNQSNGETEKDVVLDLGQTVYGGSLDWNTGLLTVTHKGVAMKDLSWYSRNGNKYIMAIVTDGRMGATRDTYLCSTFTGPASWADVEAIYNGTVNKITVGQAYFGTTCQVCVGNPSGQTVEDFKAYLESSGAFLVYPLATPTTIQLTPQGVLALAGTNTLYSSTGNTDVSGKADPNAVIQDLYSKLNALSATMAALTGV